MKKITLFLSVILISYFTFGQVSEMKLNQNKKFEPIPAGKIDLKTLKPKTKGTPRWYNYGETMDYILGGGVSVFVGNNLFPDSTILVGYSDGSYSGPWIHNIGDVLEAKAFNFNDPIYNGEPAVSNNSTYNIDSIAIYGFYFRNFDQQLEQQIDTIIPIPNDTIPMSFADTINAYGADTIVINIGDTIFNVVDAKLSGNFPAHVFNNDSVLTSTQYDFVSPPLTITEGIVSAVNDTIFINANDTIVKTYFYNFIVHHGDSVVYIDVPVDVVDTLQIEVAVNSIASALPVYYFAGSAINTNLGADTVFIHGVKYNNNTNSLVLPGKKIYKIPLTKQVADDTLDNGLNEFQISTADLPTVNAGKYVVTSYKFIPGYSWIPNVDTLSKKNRFFFLTWQENPGNWPMYTKRDFNISYLIPWDVRYNLAGSWNNLFIPSFAYMGGTDPDSYDYQHNLIYYLVNCQTNCGTVSTNDISNNDMVALGDAYPNPSNSGNIVIPFSIKAADGKNSSLKIYNTMGQLIQNFSYNYNEGNYKTVVNTDEMNAGLYYYTLETSNGRATKSFTVISE